RRAWGPRRGCRTGAPRRGRNGTPRPSGWSPSPCAPRIAAAARGVVRTAHLRDRARRVANHAGALDDVGVTQAHLDAGQAPEVLGRRRVAEVVLLDAEDA